jgi:alkanesulfonate monooxygenase SsuD/methylene tetrahydromethanopterin reductase-like flavin-dependent oxidoreductase (luciferase family)
MRFAIDIPNFGDFADPRVVADLAREVTTLDRLTGGRMVLGVRLGAPIADEFGSFGESTDPRELAARLDEGLEALNLLWSGDPVTFHGDHVRVDDVTFLPTPVQRPRVPIWLGGEWPARRPMRRAEAGATWWAECDWNTLESAAPMLRRADQGPPRG